MKTLITKTRAVSTLICLFLFLGTIQLNAQCPDTASTWVSQNSQNGYSWNSVTYGNGLFVAVAANRTMSSPDGITWTSRAAAANNRWTSVTYGNGLFVAVAADGKGNRVMTSPDGITWTIRTSAKDNGWSAVTYGNGVFVAVASSGTGNSVMTSPDGITWTIGTSVVSYNGPRAVTYGNGLFVAVAQYDVITSLDGITWTSQTSAAVNSWRSVTYGNGLFVAVTESVTGDSLMTSPDGITWTLRGGGAYNNIYSSVTYGNGLFVAVSRNGNNNRVMTSPNGIVWTIQTSSAKNGNWGSVTYGNGLFVAVGLAYTNITNVMTSSPPIVTPSVTITANTGNNITTGTSVTFTATPTNGGTTPTYQWKKNNNNSGTNSATYTDAALVNGDIITCVLTSNDPCASPVTATSTGITMVVSPVVPVLNQTFTSNSIIYIVTKVTLPYEVAVSSNTIVVGAATIPATVSNAGNSFTVTSIYKNAFYNSGLTSITIPNSVTSIGHSAFGSCQSLTTVNIPNSVTTISDIAFNSCINLISVTFPESVTTLGEGVFINCIRLTSVNIPTSVTGIGAYMFSSCTSLTSVTIPTSVTSIGEYTFQNCSGLTSLAIPNSVASIGVGAFSNCTGLKSVTVNWTTPLTINANVFEGVNLFNTTLNIPTGTATAYKNALVWKDFGTILQPVVAPVLNSFLPTTASTGATVTIIGTNFTGATAVSFGGTAATSFTVVNATTITAVVGGGASGSVSVTTAGSTAMLAGFTFCNPTTPTFTAVFPICSRERLSALPTTSNNGITGTWSPELKYSGTTTYTFTPSAGECATIATLTIVVNSTTAPTATAQTLNAGSTVANLAATGTNLQWYSTNSGGSALDSTTVLSSGTYYVSQTEYGCESTRTSVAVTTNIPNALSFCSGSKLANAIGTTSLKFYSALTGGTALAGTTSLTTKTYYATLTANGLESTPREAVAIKINVLPATPGAIKGTASQGALLGTTTTATYSIVAVAGASSYIWTVPTGVNIVSGQGTNVVTVNFATVAAGVGAIGNLSVVAVNASGCSSLAKTLALTKALPAAPAAIKMTDATLPIPVSGIPTAVTSFAQYMGTSRVLTLTATPSLTATSYEWELPTGVNQLSGGTTNVITVNFAGVTSANTYNYTTTAAVPVSTNVLRIGVKSKNGTGVSLTANGALVDPLATSTAKLLTLKAVLPTAPSAIKMTDAAASDSTKAVSNITNYIGTATVFTLTATPSLLASSYTWKLPAGVTQLTGGNTNVITVNFAGVGSGITSLYIGVKGVNGIGSSVTATNGTLVPATSSTARLLKLTATVPAAVTAVTGQISGVCGGSSYSYTITPSILATSYQITAPMGAMVTSASNISNSSNVLTTSDLTFTVIYPNGFVSTTSASKSIAIAAVNGVGTSLTSKSIALSTLMPAIGVASGGTTFTRCANQTFSIPPVVGATSYSWTVADNAVIVSGQGTSSVVVNFSAVAASKTTNLLKVAALNSCGVSSAVKSISLKTASCPIARYVAPTDKVAVDDLTTYTEIYPNPASDSFSIDVMASTKMVLEMTIYSVNGALVVSPKTVQLQEGNNTISNSISSLVRGIYIVQFVNSSNNEVITKKLIKE